MKKKTAFVSTLFAIFIIAMAMPVSAYALDDITILFTHDMHSHLSPIEETIDGRSTNYGGFARLKTLLDQNSDENTLIVDAGDFSMGTLYQTLYSSSAAELRLMGKLGYDAVTIGNHEFDYRSKGFAQMLQSAVASGDPLPQIVMSNGIIEKENPDAIELAKAMNDYPILPYTLIQKGDVKIGVFGLIGTDSDASAPMSGMDFNDVVKAAKSAVTQLVIRGADMIICLSHSGTSQDISKSEDELLAKAVPEIDLIISGHTHTQLDEPIIVKDTIIGSSGEYLMNVGKIKLTLYGGKWLPAEYSLLPVDSSVAEDPEISADIDELKKKVEDEYLNKYGFSFDQILTHSDFDFTPIDKFGTVHKEDPLGNLIADSMIYSVKMLEGKNYRPIAAAIVPAGIVRGSIKAGNINVSDTYNICSLGYGADGTPSYPLVIAYLTGKELKAVAEVDASIAPFMPAAQLYTSGLNYSFNPNRLFFNRVTNAELNFEGTPIKIEDNMLYRVVADLYSLQMLGEIKQKSFGLLSIEPKKSNGIPIENFEDQIIRDANGVELKQWYALAGYLQSFGEDGIDARYKSALGRKQIEDSKEFFDLVKNPNGIMIIIYVIILIILVAIGILIYRYVKKIKIIKALERERQEKEDEEARWRQAKKAMEEADRRGY